MPSAGSHLVDTVWMLSTKLSFRPTWLHSHDFSLSSNMIWLKSSCETTWLCDKLSKRIVEVKIANSLRHNFLGDAWRVAGNRRQFSLKISIRGLTRKRMFRHFLHDKFERYIGQTCVSTKTASWDLICFNEPVLLLEHDKVCLITTSANSHDSINILHLKIFKLLRKRDHNLCATRLMGWKHN